MSYSFMMADDVTMKFRWMLLRRGQGCQVRVPINIQRYQVIECKPLGRNSNVMHFFQVFHETFTFETTAMTRAFQVQSSDALWFTTDATLHTHLSRGLSPTGWPPSSIPPTSLVWALKGFPTRHCKTHSMVIRSALKCTYTPCNKIHQTGLKFTNED